MALSDTKICTNGWGVTTVNETIDSESGSILPSKRPVPANRPSIDLVGLKNLPSRCSRPSGLLRVNTRFNQPTVKLQ